MKKLLVSAALVFASQFAFAQAAAPAGDCAAKAVSKSGKPLVGAAKDAFIKKCEKDAGAPAAAAATAAVPAKSGCAEKAVSKSGKPLTGAAKNAFIKKCEKDAAASK